MRLIEEQMCSAVINKNDWRKDNTEVMYSPSRDVCCVYLHKNLIATINNDTVEVMMVVGNLTRLNQALMQSIKGCAMVAWLGFFQRTLTGSFVIV